MNIDVGHRPVFLFERVTPGDPVRPGHRPDHDKRHEIADVDAVRPPGPFILEIGKSFDFGRYLGELLEVRAGEQ